MATVPTRVKARFKVIGHKDGLVDRVVQAMEAHILGGRLAVGTGRAGSRAEVVKPLALFLRTRGEEISIQHLHQVRSILEVENAALAADQGTSEDVRDLTRICEEMEAAAEDPAQFALKDSEFHR